MKTQVHTQNVPSLFYFGPWLKIREKAYMQIRTNEGKKEERERGQFYNVTEQRNGQNHKVILDDNLCVCSMHIKCKKAEMASSIIFFCWLLLQRKEKKCGVKKTSNLCVVFVVALQKGWIWSDYSHSLFVGKILFLLLEQIGRCPIIDHTRATIWKQHFFLPMLWWWCHLVRWPHQRIPTS